MNLTNEAAAGGSEHMPIDVAVHQAAGEGPMSPRAAAHAVTDWRRKRHVQQAVGAQNTGEHAPNVDSAMRAVSSISAITQVGEVADPTAPLSELADVEALAAPSAEASAPADAGEPLALPGEIKAPDAAVDLPPIEPPRSWTKDDKALFKDLPRDTQERLAERERSRDSDISRRQQEATERAKALEAERSKVEQARQFYENALPIVLRDLHAKVSGEFSDIRSLADAEKLAKEDYPRYARWDLRQRNIAAVQQELNAALLHQAQERQHSLSRFMQREREMFAEKAPEFADEAQQERLRSAAVTVLNDHGFDDTELGQLWRGEKELSLHDHRIHLVLRDAIRWREAQDKAKAAQAKPVPPVVRPGVAQPKAAVREAALQNLSKQLDNAKGMNALRAAARLVAARRQG